MNPLISGMRGAEIGASNVALVQRFYEDVWSLRTIKAANDIVQFAGSAAEHPILTVVGGGTMMRRMIWNARSMAALDEIHGRLRAAGLPVSASHRAFDDGFGIGFDSRDPEGRMVSFVAQDGAPPRPLIPDRISKVTHLNLNCGAYEAMRMHMGETLGFRVVDETRTNGFFNCDIDHHALVIGRSPMQPTLNHIAFEMPDLDSMMRMCGTMRENGYPIEWGVGRHGPGDNVFAYFAGPEDMPIECTAEVLQIDKTYAYRGPQDWGFPPGRTDQWGVTDAPSPRIKRIQKQFPFIELPLR
jgi:catechol 2,3-dioxygenase-like lactoylglutathione lyase family enzyme